MRQLLARIYQKPPIKVKQMNKPHPNSIAGIARRCGLSRSHVLRVARGERKPGDTPAGRKLARILSRRNAAAAK